MSEENQTLKQPAVAEVPQYQLTERAYIDDTLLEPGEKISYSGIPGYHMEPLNAAAKAMKKKHDIAYVNPIEAMTKL